MAPSAPEVSPPSPGNSTTSAGGMPIPESEIRDERLVIDVIDEIAAQHPDRVWASLPADDTNLGAGFHDVTYRALANAIDTAAFWLDSVFRDDDDDSSSGLFAFYGDRDFRQPILAAAAAKTGRQYQFISPFSAESAKLGLINHTSCNVWIHTETGRELAESLAKSRPGLRVIECPTQAELLQSRPERQYQSRITWEDSKDKVWVIFHTTGSSGNPKPVPWTHKAFRSTDRLLQFPNFAESKTAVFRNKRFFQPLACVHGLGLITIFDIVPAMNAPMVIGPRDRLPTMDDIRLIFEHGRLDGMLCTPVFIKEIVEQEDLLPKLRALDFVYYAGAKADRAWGDLLYEHTSVGPIFGTTETGHVPLRNIPGPDWHWYSFYDWEGLAFEEVKPGLYEMVVNRAPPGSKTTWQHAFSSFPDRSQYRTRDLWIRHPERPNLYAYHGRADDFVMLTCGDGVDAPYLQSKLEAACPAVKMAMVGGHGEDRPWLLLELRESVVRGDAAGDLGWVLQFMAVLEDLNSTLPYITRISPKRIILAAPDRPLVRTGKQALDRNKTAELYEKEIEALEKLEVRD